MGVDSAAPVRAGRAGRLRRCLNPRSIAVVGGAEAAQVSQQCRKLGFAGDLWPGNPKRVTLEGLACYPSIESLPAPPDAAFIAIPAEPSIATVAALSRLGAGGAVCYASGFGETGDAGDGDASGDADGDGGGGGRQRRLIQAAGCMPVIGPNCYGFLNLLCGAALWPDYHGARRADRGVAVFSQSGNVSLNLSMQRRLLPLAWLVTLGNQAVVGIEAGIAAALDCDAITAIGLHLEGLSDPPEFARLAEQARRKGIPMVALKSGRSATGARITRSHTATLAGERALYDALFERLGIGRVATPEEFIEALKLLSVTGAPSSNRIASMSCSGGEAALVADLAVDHAGLEFPPLEAAHRQQVRATLNEHVRVDNPLDYHTFIWGDTARMTATFRAMMAGNFDLTLLVLDFPADDRAALERWLCAARAFIAACRATAGAGAVVSLLSENLPEEAGNLLLENGIAPLHGLGQALAAVAAACEIGRARTQNAPPPTLAPLAGVGDGVGVGMPGREVAALDEAQAKKLLAGAGAGLSVPRSAVVDSPDGAVEVAGQLGYPVVVKALSKTIAHKTESGAVAVNLRDAEQVRAQAARMLGSARRLLVEEMVAGAVAELLLGVSHDPQFGHYLIIGFGGALVELIGDRQLLLPPVDEAMLRRALNDLKTAPLLRGYRGQPPGDVEAVIQCALRLTRWLENAPDGVLEIEINPLMVKSETQGAVVADALITLGGEDE